MRQHLVLLASGLLAGFYAWVAYVALHPSVGIAYAAYYIHRTSALTIIEQGEVGLLVPGVTYSPTATAFALDGWQQWDGTRRLSARRDPAIIFLVAPEVARVEGLCVRLGLAAASGGPVTATLNGIPVPVRIAGLHLDVGLGTSAMRPGENVVSLGLSRSDIVSLVSLGIVPADSVLTGQTVDVARASP